MKPMMLSQGILTAYYLTKAELVRCLQQDEPVGDGEPVPWDVVLWVTLALVVTACAVVW